MTELFIEVVKWPQFQHYGEKRDPVWIKNYLRLLHDDDYLDLSSHRRGVLHGVWLMYAAKRRRLPLDTSSLSRQLNLRVTAADIDALIHAGFVTVAASKPLAKRKQTAIPEKEREKEREANASPRKPDELWDALAVELGEPKTRSARSVRGKVLKELRDAGATPGQVRLKASTYRKRWPKMSFTDLALAKHWTTLEAPNGQVPAVRCPECGIGFQADLSLQRHRATVHDVVAA